MTDRVFFMTECKKCKRGEILTEIPNLWCERFMQRLTNATVEGFAKLGCEKAKRWIEEHKNDDEQPDR